MKLLFNSILWFTLMNIVSCGKQMDDYSEKKITIIEQDSLCSKIVFIDSAIEPMEIVRNFDFFWQNEMIDSSFQFIDTLSFVVNKLPGFEHFFSEYLQNIDGYQKDEICSKIFSNSNKTTTAYEFYMFGLNFSSHLIDSKISDLKEKEKYKEHYTKIEEEAEQKKIAYMNKEHSFSSYRFNDSCLVWLDSNNTFYTLSYKDNFGWLICDIASGRKEKIKKLINETK